MKPRRTAVLIVGIIVSGAGSWALYRAGALKGGVAVRLGAGLCVGLVLLVVLPVLWPPRTNGVNFDRAVRPSPAEAGERPAMLHETEFVVSLATSAKGGGYDLHYRLRPLLVDLARHRLYSHRLVDLDGPEDEVRAALGDDLWEIVRPGRPAPSDRSSPGVTPVQLASIVRQLESL